MTFFTNKEKIDLLFHIGTMKVHAFVETCHQGIYSWSTELRAMRTVWLWDSFLHFRISSAYVTTNILFRESNGAKIPQFPTDSCLVATIWMEMSQTFAAQPWRAHRVSFVFSALWRSIMLVTGFLNVAQVREVVSQWFRSPSPDFWAEDIHSPMKCCDKCIEPSGRIDGEVCLFFFTTNVFLTNTCRKSKNSISLLTLRWTYVPGKHTTKELQKTAVLVTAHILRKIIMPKCKMFVLGK